MARTPSHDIERTPAGLRLRGTSLYLDATLPSELSFVSHAHGDHIARHRMALGTAPTLALTALRVGDPASELAVPYRQPFSLGALDLELFPAGHVLGSAQLRIAHGDTLIVYTGDLNPIPSLTAEPAEVAPCDLLVIESTFGVPRYRLPPREDTCERIRGFVAAALAEGAPPILFAYSLGKAQEGMKLLLDAGLPLAVHPSIAKICDVYERFGVALPHRVFNGEWRDGEAYLFPPTFDRDRAAFLPPRARTAFLTGWALDPGAKWRYGVDEAFPLSDHGDFEALVAYIAATGAKKILTLHGFDKEFAACLRDRGFDAEPLVPPRQRELF